MVNELTRWFKKRKKKLIILKVNFEKAYDSICWDYLDRILLLFMGFGERWRSWVRAMFSDARSSVLLNGCPREEFQLFRGLHQGGPLSPFLFIIAMEGLHIVMEDVVAQGVFCGVPLNSDDIFLSHLFY